LVLYGAGFGKDAPGIRSIWCSIPHIGGSPVGISLGKTSKYSYKMLATVGARNVAYLELKSKHPYIPKHRKQKWKQPAH
jgi:hypothetical protein